MTSGVLGEGRGSRSHDKRRVQINQNVVLKDSDGVSMAGDPVFCCDEG